MRNLIIRILIIACFSNLTACDSEWWDDGFSPADHFTRNLFDFGYLGTTCFRKNDNAVFSVYVKSFKEPLTKIDLKVTLPPEVKLLKGNLHWKGNLGIRSEKRLDLQVHSKTNMKDWSAPITMHVKFGYKGEKIVGVQNRSYECSKSECISVWTKNGKETFPYENIDKEEWLSDQKQDK